MRQRIIAASAVVGLAMVGLVVLLTGQRVEKADRETVTIAVAPLPASAPVYVADERGLFGKEGLDVTLLSYPVGKDALESVIRGQNDFCTVAETPVMFAGLKGEKIAVIATICESRRFAKIVARRDAGIIGPENLEHKKIGVQKGTNGEYYLHAYLTFNAIPAESVEVVDVKLPETPAALAGGEIDAAVTWEPHLAILRKELGANGIVLTNDHVYALHWNLVAGRDFVARRPQTVEKLLRAIQKADEYIGLHPEKARAIAARAMGERADTFEDNQFRLSLGQALLVNLESQARWAIGNRLTPWIEVPNFLHLLYVNGLEAVEPEAVTVIHP